MRNDRFDPQAETFRRLPCQPPQLGRDRPRIGRGTVRTGDVDPAITGPGDPFEARSDRHPLPVGITIGVETEPHSFSPWSLNVSIADHESGTHPWPTVELQPFPFALIPAAGRSRRMGSPKLLLDLAGQTVIARVLAALGRAGLTNRLVVIHPQDDVLKREVERHGGRALTPPTAPPEMRDSVAFGLRHVADDLEASGESDGPTCLGC